MNKQEKVISLTVDSFELLEQDEDVSIVKLKLYHLGVNRNKCDITKKSSELSQDTIFNKPIVYRLNNKYMPKLSTDVLEHSQDGDPTMLIAGTIPSDTKITYEYDEKSNKTYVVVTGILYKAYQPTLISVLKKKKGVTKISIEIVILEGKTNKDGILVIDKFKFRGVALLGDKIPEGIVGSKLDVVKFSDTKNYLNEIYHKFSNSNKEVEITNEMKNNIKELFNKYKKDFRGFTDKEIIVLNTLSNADYCTANELMIIKSCFDNLNKNIQNTDLIIEKEVKKMSISVEELRENLVQDLGQYVYDDDGFNQNKYWINEIYYEECTIIVQDSKTMDLYKMDYEEIEDKIIIDEENKQKVKKTYEVFENEDEEAYVFSKKTYGSGKKITLDKTKKSMSDASWGDVNKTTQRKSILDAPNYKTLVKSVYLEIPSDWEDAPSKLGYPVMELIGDKLVYNRKALASARGYAETNNDTEVINKLKSIYKKLELDEEQKEVKNSMTQKEKEEALKNKLKDDNKHLEEIKEDIDSDEDDEKEALKNKKIKKNKIEQDDEDIEDLEDDEDADKDYWKKKYARDMEVKNKELDTVTAKCNAYERSELETKMNSLVEEYAEHFSKEDEESLAIELKNAKTEEEFSGKVFSLVAKNVKKEKTKTDEVSVFSLAADSGYGFSGTKTTSNILDIAKSYKDKGDK